MYAIIAIEHDFVIHYHSQRPSGESKTPDFALGFQQFPRDLANINEWKIMFDPSCIKNVIVFPRLTRGFLVQTNMVKCILRCH